MSVHILKRQMLLLYGGLVGTTEAALSCAKACTYAGGTSLPSPLPIPVSAVDANNNFELSNGYIMSSGNSQETANFNFAAKDTDCPAT